MLGGKAVSPVEALQGSMVCRWSAALQQPAPKATPVYDLLVSTGQSQVGGAEVLLHILLRPKLECLLAGLGCYKGGLGKNGHLGSCRLLQISSLWLQG